MDHAKKEREVDKEELATFSKKLENYKTLTASQLKGILENINQMKFTFEDLKNAKLGNHFKAINSDPKDDDDFKEIKAIIKQIGKKAQLSKDQAKPTSEPKKTEKQTEAKKEERKSETPIDNGTDDGISTINLEGLDKLPILDPPMRNFVVKTIAEGLLIEYKNDPKGQEFNRRIANKVGVAIENYLFTKMGNDISSGYKTESTSLIAYIKEKSNQELRMELLRGTADVKLFVEKKEVNKDFLNQNAKARLEKINRAILDANDADYHKKLIKDSLIYSCRRCKSKKIHKEEKQIRGGDEPMTSFFTCLDCGGGWREG